MFKHSHPYEPFLRPDTEKLIVGTLPPPRFSTGDLLEKDVDFPYGSYYNSLWLFIDRIHNLKLSFDNSQTSIDQRKQFLVKNKIGVCDIVESAERQKIDASDLGMSNIRLRDIIGYLKKYPSIHTLLFTGGNSKNGPEYFFRKHVKEYGIKLNVVSGAVPRIHEFNLPSSCKEAKLHQDIKFGQAEILNTRTIKTVSLTSASGSANRAIGSMPLYKQLKNSNPDFNTFDFRVMQYREFF